MKKHLIVIGMLLILLVVGLSGCTENNSPDNGYNGENQYTPKPNIKTSSYETRKGYEGVDYCFYIDIVVRNYGDGGGSSDVWAEVKQDGNTWEKRQNVYLNSGESDSLTLSFCEISYWSGGDITYRVWTE